MTRRKPVPPRPRRGGPPTASVELVDGRHIVGVVGDYIRWPVQPERVAS